MAQALHPILGSRELTLMSKYSETLMDHLLAPRNGGVIKEPDLAGHAGAPGRGPFLILYLRVREGHVAEAKYST